MPEAKPFPTIPFSNWQTLRNQFKKTIPGVISSNYIASILKMTESSARGNILPSLKHIALIDNDGKTNQELARKLRDDSLYPEFCKQVIENIYPQEFKDAFPDKSSDKNSMKTWIMNHNGNGESAANKIVNFYVTLLEANPNLDKNISSSKNGENKMKMSKAILTKPPTAEPKEKENDVNNKGISKQNNNTPSLNINIQIHISSDASSDQIKGIFENMSKYLYNNTVNAE